jgi:hypothetical protein
MKKNLKLFFALILTCFRIVFAQPTITSFSPLNAPVGATITINGTNFNATPTNNNVFFGAAKANIVSGTTTSLSVVVPYGATYNYINVIDLSTGLSANSTKPFMITFPYGGNISAASFDPKFDFIAGTDPYSVSLGDLDNDGKIDLIVPNNLSGNISILRNTSVPGTISLASKIDITTGTNPLRAAIADITGDGRLDIIVANAGSNSLSILRNISTIGNISFAPKVDITTNSSPYDVAVGDLDGDGKQDLVVANQGINNISVFRNTGVGPTITFAPKIDYNASSFMVSPWAVSVGDFDGDNKIDIVVGNNGSNNISAFKNNSIPGSISFSAASNFNVGSTVRGVKVGDLDGDGKLDISGVAASAFTFLNTSPVGTISFGASQTNPTVNSTNCSLGDLNGDGKIDVAFSSTGFIVQVKQNTSSIGGISLAAAINLTTGGGSWGSAIGDIDGDGRPDISTSISIFRNKSCGTYIPSAGNNGPVCTGTVLSLSTPTIVGATYSWSGPNGFTSSQQSPSISANATASMSGTYSITTTINGCVSSAGTTSVIINPTPSVAVSNATICSGNSVNLTATGATTYSWNTGATSTSIAVTPNVTSNYTVNGTTNGCTNTKTVSVTVKVTPTVAVSNATICSGTSANLTATGATTYSWNTGGTTAAISVTPSTTTNYTVTGTTNGCTNTKTVSVNVKATPTVAVNNATICSGNSANITASGATTYSWNTGATSASIAVTPNVSSNYTVNGITNGCTNTKTVSVTVKATPTVAVSNATICSGNTANLTATGATTYSWNTGGTTAAISVTPSTTTNYTVTGTTNGCANTKTVSVEVNQIPIVNLSSIQSPLCVNNSTVSLSGTPLGGIFGGIGVSGASFNPAVSGAGTFTINYTYTDANNCSATASESVNVNLCTGIIELNSYTISIFPNPASTEITISTPAKFTDVKLVNSIGQIVGQTKYSNTVSVVELSSGIYFVQLFNENGKLLKVAKIVKE